VTQAISASLDMTVRVWLFDPPCAVLCIPTCHSGPITSLFLWGEPNEIESADEHAGLDDAIFITGSEDKTIKVWKYQNGVCQETCEGHFAAVRAVSIFPGKTPYIISGASDLTVRVWQPLEDFRYQAYRTYSDKG
jgi:WD40 repeat protein